MGRRSVFSTQERHEVNESLRTDYPGVMPIAEESTAWPGVSRPVQAGGLGFAFKWNMGWMHDTLEYFQKDSVFRRYHHHQLTFGLLYAFSERFVLPLSHDEVVHGKASLIGKMPGDRWQQFANLRGLLAWMWAHPGKQLLFMGGEFGQYAEWSADNALDWHLVQYPEHSGLQQMVRDLGARYRENPALWQRDVTPDGFRWIDAGNVDQNIYAFIRYDANGHPGIACVANFSPVVHSRFRVGLPLAGTWREVLNTDATEYAGGGVGNMGAVQAESLTWHGQPFSAEMTMPPLAVLWLGAPRPDGPEPVP